MFRLLPLVLVMTLTALAGGVQAATFELKDFQGKPASLSDYTGKGKWVVVMIWAYDCHVCNQEAHEYVKFHAKHKDGNAVMLGISLDGEANKKDAEAFISRHKLNFPNLIGEADKIVDTYVELTGESRFGTPTFLVYNPKGELVAQQVGAIPPKLIEDFIRKESAAGVSMR